MTLLRPFIKTATLCLTLGVSSGCVKVHHVQLGDIDNTAQGLPMEIALREIGVDAEKVAKTAERLNRLANALQGRRTNKSNSSGIIGMFQSGPKTGAPIYNDRFGENLMAEIHQKCPSAKVRNVHSVRQASDYGDTGITQEIVLVRFMCLDYGQNAPQGALAPATPPTTPPAALPAKTP